MAERVLITGGAGFIGSHLADGLIARGHRVRVLDVLAPQVHGPHGRRPVHLAPEAELVVGDVRDRHAVRRSLEGVDVVFHLAAAVGVGQSMYEIAAYTDVNNVGTAILLEEVARARPAKLVVASSMSLYGEGAYRTSGGTVVHDVARDPADLRAGRFEPHLDGEPLEPVPTPEDKPPSLSSVYALGKFDQERLCLMMGRAYGVATVALRFFNVYGPRQALSNPYTGVLAIFGSRLLNGRRPLVFEDGAQRRDFVSVHDVVAACRLAMERDGVDGSVFNVGSGRSVTIRELAERMARTLGRPDLPPEITGRVRVGDIRHCVADISAARAKLGYEPRVELEQGIEELGAWLRTQTAEDHVERARRELDQRGLTL